MMAKVTLFKESGKYYTEEEWRVPENAISPRDMIRSEDFRRIGKGAVLVQSQEPWGYPCLFPYDFSPEPDGYGPPRVESIPHIRRRLADYLSEYAHGVVEEWMRIVEIDEDVDEPGSSAFQARATWMGDGTFTLGLRPHESDLGQYQLFVRVDALPDLPPICPENDPAQRYEAEEIEPVAPAPEWIAAEWQYVLTGDRVRIGQQEADVEWSSVLQWHADNTDPYRPKAWEHTEVTVKLAHLDSRLPFPPGGPVEVLMDRERQAVHLLQTSAGAKTV